MSSVVIEALFINLRPIDVVLPVHSGIASMITATVRLILALGVACTPTYPRS
jgi:hypothetical protein